MIINRNDNRNLYFGIKISDSAEKTILRQLKVEGKKTRKLAEQQFENIKNWEPDDAELVLAKNSEGNTQLGLRYPLNEFVKGSWTFEHLNSRTVLSSFLKLKEKHVYNTINNIKFLYEKRGPQFFEKTKVETIYDKVRSGKF